MEGQFIDAQERILNMRKEKHKLEMESLAASLEYKTKELGLIAQSEKDSMSKRLDVLQFFTDKIANAPNTDVANTISDVMKTFIQVAFADVQPRSGR
ncbi:hypothetical protein CVT24_001833 [Panaeolus cyanescens]|uniref:Uncharacterized protein n=1 Tax=Panaeolus cyanescens TaxID=181874 RepID=A0A409WSA2_9AGAR|nr:hypothetical protein CVT24_001833 [Panaeolus cyanescens]